MSMILGTGEARAENGVGRENYIVVFQTLLRL
jgi:hypothetical protein